MNLGFKAATAPYICMLSDDCLVVPGAIRNGLERFEREGDDVGAVAFYWRNWPEQERYWVGRTFGGTLFVNHGLFRREAMAAVGFADEEAFRFYHADADLVCGWRTPDGRASILPVPSSSTSHMRTSPNGRRTSRREMRTGPPMGTAGAIWAPQQPTGSSSRTMIRTAPPADIGD